MQSGKYHTLLSYYSKKNKNKKEMKVKFTKFSCGQGKEYHNKSPPKSASSEKLIKKSG